MTDEQKDNEQDSVTKNVVSTEKYIQLGVTLPAATFLGWLFGLGHFSFGNTWIATAFTHQAAMPAWLGWLAVVLLAGYLAIYPGLAVAAGWRLGRANPRAQAIKRQN